MFFQLGAIHAVAATTAARYKLPSKYVEDQSGNAPHEGRGGALIGRTARMQVVAGGNDVFFRWGDSSVTATLTGERDIRLQAGAIEEFNIPIDATHVSLIATTGTPTVEVDVGSNR